jgi:NAD(P)-dependent dehydrogenase (short-subunit alcohol dehydrogenase family)
LRASGKIPHVVQCDVTKEEDVEKIANYTKKLIEDSDTKGNTLKMWGLINNAGIAPSGFVDWISMKSVRAVMEVNYFAIVSMCKAFLPLLKTTKHSRVLNVSSAAGFSGFPGGSSYCGTLIVL